MASYVLRRERRASHGRRHDLDRELSAGNPHAQFDERGEETGLRERLRHRQSAKAVGKRLLPHAKASALLLDPTSSESAPAAASTPQQLTLFEA